MPSVIESGFGSSKGPVPCTGPCRARSAVRVYDDVPPVAAQRPSTVMVISAVPVQAAGRRSPVPGRVGAVVVTDVDRSAPGVAPPLWPSASVAASSGRLPPPDGASVVLGTDPPAAVEPGPDSAAEALAAGVDDEAGFWPVIWISPHTTTTEQTRATTMITVTHRVLRVLRVAITPV